MKVDSTKLLETSNKKFIKYVNYISKLRDKIKNEQYSIKKFGRTKPSEEDDGELD
jgi:hypothetical protein